MDHWVPADARSRPVLGAGLRCLLGPSPPVVGVVHVQEHVPAGDARLQLGADEEGASHLAMERVRLLRWGGEAVAQHDGNEALDSLSRALGAKVEGLGGRKRFTENHHCLYVSVLKSLMGETERASTVATPPFTHPPSSARRFNLLCV